MRRLIFVTTWYGPDTIGGAELLCRRLAEEMRHAGYPVEVFTTTSRGYVFPWFESHYPEGRQEWNGVPIHRFAVDRWEEVPFFEEHLDLLRSVPTFPPEEVAHLIELPQSDGLYRTLAQASEDIFFFFIYSHNLSFWGAQLAPERSFLVPCLHDEPYAYHAATHFLMNKVHGQLFISHPERQLALDLYNLNSEAAHFMGAGVDTDWQGDQERFRTGWGIDGPFVLYVGRRDGPKLVPLLVQFFCTYKQRRGGEVKLLLAGPGQVHIPAGFTNDVVDLGVLSEQDKHDAYAAATVLCQPSPIESFSIVLMESWLQGTPVLVNADCAVTTHHCQQSNGGLYYRNYLEFESCLEYLLERPGLRQRMGEAGRTYVLEHYTWPAVVRRLVESLEASGFSLELSVPSEE